MTFGGVAILWRSLDIAPVANTHKAISRLFLIIKMTKPKKAAAGCWDSWDSLRRLWIFFLLSRTGECFIFTYTRTELLYIEGRRRNNIRGAEGYDGEGL